MLEKTRGSARANTGRVSSYTSMTKPKARGKCGRQLQTAQPKQLPAADSTKSKHWQFSRATPAGSVGRYTLDTRGVAPHRPTSQLPKPTQTKEEGVWCRCRQTAQQSSQKSERRVAGCGNANPTGIEQGGRVKLLGKQRKNSHTFKRLNRSIIKSCNDSENAQASSLWLAAPTPSKENGGSGMEEAVRGARLRCSEQRHHPPCRRTQTHALATLQLRGQCTGGRSQETRHRSRFKPEVERGGEEREKRE